MTARTQRLIIIGAFLVFGFAVGFGHVWFDEHTDSILPLDMPGYFAAEGMQTAAVHLSGEPHPTVAYHLAPLLLWGIVGTLFAFFLRTQLVAIIAGAYLFVFGGWTVAWFVV